MVPGEATNEAPRILLGLIPHGATLLIRLQSSLSSLAACLEEEGNKQLLIYTYLSTLVTCPKASSKALAIT